MQRVGAEFCQRLHSGGHRGADAAAALGKAFAPLGGNTQNLTKRIIDAARGCIEIGVHADGGDAVFHQQRGHIIGGQTFDGLEDDRMVADNKLAIILDRLPHDRGGDVQRVSTPSTGLPASTSRPTLSQLRAKPLRSRRPQQT